LSGTGRVQKSLGPTPAATAATPAKANRDLWERLLRATRRHHQVLWRKVRGHSKSGGPHKSGNDPADELAVAAKKEATRSSTPSSP